MRDAWRLRRWVYGAWMAVAVLRIPARVHFGLVAPACDVRLTRANAALSMTKVPHVVLFGIFFLLTALQFDTLSRRALCWSLAATAGLGLLVELEEGASRTGNCRLTDVLPDVAGALLTALLLVAVTQLRGRVARSRHPHPEIAADR
jgi:hypothetical protein